MHIHTKAILAGAIVLSLLPIPAFGGASTADKLADGKPFEQTFVVTAYYSPLPDQCCYVLGSLEADQEMNGMGMSGADGTPVYAGMLAGPPTYPFGTRIDLEGLGIATIHDRGGAIQELKDVHRLDVWAGYGEEGLARAIAFGVKRVNATVYPLGSVQPAEAFDLTQLPSPPDRIRPYLADSTTLFDISAKLGDKSASTEFLQERLAAIGYFSERPTGLFGPATREALKNFAKDMNVDTSGDALDDSTAAALEAAYARRTAIEPIPGNVETGSAPSKIAEAKRTLHFLDAYSGRMNGEYDESLQKSVIAFQKKEGIITSATEAGAGRIGPQTRKRIVLLWRRKHIALRAGQLLAARKIDQMVADRGYDIERFLTRGQKGEQVTRLQRFLRTQGYLKKGVENGVFGIKTEQAVVAYQKDHEIVKNGDPGAGTVGPATLLSIRRDLRQSLLKVVRASGWDAI